MAGNEEREKQTFTGIRKSDLMGTVRVKKKLFDRDFSSLSSDFGVCAARDGVFSISENTKPILVYYLYRLCRFTLLETFLLC